MASGANDYLVVWADYRSATVSSWSADIYGVRVSKVGKLLDSTPILISAASSTTKRQSSPAVAYGWGTYLVSWDLHDGGTGAGEIRGARVSPAGKLLDSPSISISASTSDLWSPSLAYGGGRFLVAWAQRSKSGGFDIHGARVTPAGLVHSGRDGRPSPRDRGGPAAGCFASPEEYGERGTGNGTQNQGLVTLPVP